MKKLIEIFGLGVLMILGGSMTDYYLSTFSLMMVYSGIAVMIWGEVLFIWRIIQKCINWFKKSIDSQTE